MTPVFKGIIHDDYVGKHVTIQYQQAFLWFSWMQIDEKR